MTTEPILNLRKSNQAELYAGYVQRFHAARPHLVQPQTKFTRSEVEALSALARQPGARVIGNLCRFYSGVAVTHELADGRVVELAEVIGAAITRHVAAVWPTYKAWSEYERPQPFVAYFERW